MTKTQGKRVRVVNRQLVPVKRLKDAKHNPKGRIEPKFLRGLMDSMDLIGQLHPITISPNWVIIDGHRRRAAARLLGWKDVEVNIVEEDPLEVYRSVNNGSSKRINGNDALNIWLISAGAVPETTGTKIGEMAKFLGREYVIKVADAGYSVKFYHFARQLARYCEMDDPGNVKTIIDWLINTAVIGQVQKAIETQSPSKVFLDAIRKNKPIVFKATVQE